MDFNNRKTISVFTAIDGWRDKLLVQNNKGAKFIAYLPSYQENETWEIRELPRLFVDPVRNAKIIKVLNHFYCDTEYSIWIDGNCRLLRPAQDLIDLLGDKDIVFARHNKGDCIYDEAMLLKLAKKDDPNVIDAHTKRYEREIPNHYGMLAGGIIIRRNNDRCREFNAMWWAEITGGTKRDQISLPYALMKSNVRWGKLDWSIEEPNEYFEFINHL